MSEPTPRRRPEVWVVDPSLNHPEDQGVSEILRDWRGSSRLFQPALRPGSGPDPDTGYDTDGVVLLGSAASVYDAHDWLPPLSTWLRPLLHGRFRLPLLGICFGHQLIAHLARGKVDWLANDQEKVLGAEESQLSGGRLLPGNRSLRVLVSHREVVTGVPDGYRVTAERPRSPIDGLEHLELPIYTFQFHPEAREEFARRAGLAAGIIDDRLRRDSRLVIEAFLDEVVEHAGKKKEPAGDPPAPAG